MKKVLKIIGLVLLIHSVANATNALDKPVMIGSEAGLDACMSVGAVSGLDPQKEGFLAVRSSPSVKAKLLDKLAEGKQVSVCDTSADGKWVGIVYSKKGLDCGVGSSVPRKQAYTGRCYSGWVNANFLTIIAG